MKDRKDNIFQDLHYYGYIIFLCVRVIEMFYKNYLLCMPHKSTENDLKYCSYTRKT